MSRRPVICLSPHYWAGSWFRKQHFMSRLAELGHQVLYVEPSHSLLRPTGQDGRTTNPLVRAQLASVASGIWTLRPARLYPKPLLPWSSRLNHLRIVRNAARVAEHLGMQDPLWWVYNPRYAPALMQIPKNRLVFDLVDDLVGYAQTADRAKYTSKCVQDLAQRAGWTFCTSKPLQQQLLDMGVSPAVVPNGFDARLFKPSPKTDTNSAPRRRRPVIGFVGTLFDFLDFGLLARIAAQIPDAELALLGHIESRQAAVSSLLSLPNVRHIDLVPREKVPAILETFDVCVAPFNQNAVSVSVSPLKVYEYLAMHKPVVCTPMRGLEQEAIARFIDFAEQPDDFVSVVRERLKGWPVDFVALDTHLADCTWDARFQLVREHLGQDVLGG